MKSLILLIFVPGWIFLWLTPAMSQTKPVVAEDFYELKEITDLALSPDGRYLVYVVQGVERARNVYYSQLWLRSQDGARHFSLTGRSTAQNFAPAWSPDSRFLVFISTRSGKPQLWMIDVNGGEAWTLLQMPRGAWNPVWSPDGKKIVFVSQVQEAPPVSSYFPDKKDVRRLRDHKDREFAADVKTIDRLRYREGTEYLEQYYRHLFVVSSTGTGLEQLTDGAFNDSAPVWSPDSKTIAFLSNRRSHPDLDENLDLCLVPADGGPVQILLTSPGVELSPDWSPDGKQLAYVATTRLNDLSEQFQLWTISSRGGVPRAWTQNLDRTVTDNHWSADGKALFFLVKDQGNQHLYRIDLNRPVPQPICTGAREIKKFCPDGKNNWIYFIATEPANPADLFLFDLTTQRETRLTHVNQAILAQRDLSTPETLWYSSPDGLMIQGWYLRPPSPMESAKLPLVVEIHGGPYWNYGNRWELEFQLLAARGYGVFYCNPRVSSGYGQAFAAREQRHWGEGDSGDILAGIRTLIQRGWVDSTRMGVAGGSYGGYLTNWLIAHTTCFKAAVTQRSLVNLISFYGTTDIQAFVEFEFGLPWQNYTSLWERSPLCYAAQMNVPLLILHAELDYRVPISQAEELYVTLKRRGIPVEFVRYPNEGHELSRSGEPLHRVDRLNRIVNWFDRYLP
ncbi:S9 family peptidase [candidate division KSB1 bacterium]|nr:S9 family peptidase [candidate division KSB1 bacterium]